MRFKDEMSSLGSYFEVKFIMARKALSQLLSFSTSAVKKQRDRCWNLFILSRMPTHGAMPVTSEVGLHTSVYTV